MKDRDIAAFDNRATRYEAGPIGHMHQRIAEHVADIALASVPAPRHVLDVGCGTGTLLQLLATRLQQTEQLVGIDPAPQMIRAASSRDGLDLRIRFVVGVAETLPLDTDSTDLIVSTTSFDHWTNQRAGLAECARVLRAGCPLVLCDLFSPILLPTMWLGHRGKARTVRSGTSRLRNAGFQSLAWHASPLFKTVVATAR